MQQLISTGLFLLGTCVVFATSPAAEHEHGQKQPVGTVASVRLGDEERSNNIQGRLHFCVFENGEQDYIYVGTVYGMWSDGEFDLSIDGKLVFTGHVPHLVYEGTIIEMGDVLKDQPRSNIGVHITRISGWFK